MRQGPFIVHTWNLQLELSQVKVAQSLHPLGNIALGVQKICLVAASSGDFLTGTKLFQF